MTAKVQMGDAAGPVLEAVDLSKEFTLRGGPLGPLKVLRAVDAVSFRLAAGETLAIVGESGCGKSTTARLATRLLQPSSGAIFVDGIDVSALDSAAMHAMRPRIQIVFQDPYASLNPRMTIGEAIAEPLRNYRVGDAKERESRVAALIARVGLSAEFTQRYPHQLSGGQRQRVGIARALALDPDIVVLDEAVSALDVSVQAQIINLLMDLQAERGIAYLFISHDLAVVRHISDRVAVMYLGAIVEEGETETLFHAPQHPYTRALLDAAPASHPKTRRVRQPLSGEPPNPVNPPPGCAFHPRCPLAHDRCRQARPTLEPTGRGSMAACFALTRPG